MTGGGVGKVVRGRTALPGRWPVSASLAPFLWLLAACDLGIVTLAEPEDYLLAEIYLEVPEGGAPARASAFIHRTLGASGSDLLPETSVTLTAAGRSVRLPEETSGTSSCLDPLALSEVSGRCFHEPRLPPAFAVPGAVIEARVEASGFGTLTGATRPPGDFVLLAPEAGIEACILGADEALEIQWTRSEGAWAYLGESVVSGLAGVLASRGSEVTLDEDPLHLLGLSISAADTTMVFPGEFGVFGRIDLEREVAVLLQEGLPENTSAQVSIAAVDRNYVNWVRGGSFNPSGTVRVPSLRGERGSGVFASSVRKGFRLLTVAAEGIEAC